MADPQSPALIEPTNAVLFWPGAMAPVRDAIEQALGAALRDTLELLEMLPVPVAMPTAWAAAYRWPGRAAPVVLWTEPIRLADEERRAIGLSTCAWTVGVETLLDAADPASDFETMMRAIARVEPLLPAVLDVNTATYLRRNELDGVLSDPAFDVALSLWVVHAVENEQRGETWLHTHGLNRCGRPELEMLGVPSARAAAAAALIDDVAERVLETDPGNETTFDLGPGLTVSARAVGDVVPRLAPGAPGNASDRQDDAHAGHRIVLGDADDDASTWPAAVVDALATTASARYLSARAADRRGRMARTTIDEAVAAHAAVTARRCVAQFLVQAGIASGREEIEHLWFEIDAVGGQVFEGRLVHPPMNAPLEPGDRRVIGRDEVSDWRLDVEGASFTPERAGAMRIWLETEVAPAGADD